MEEHSIGQEPKKNHEMTELELYRKAVVQKDEYIDLLKRNITDQQEEIHHLQLRVKALLDAQHN